MRDSAPADANRIDRLIVDSMDEGAATVSAHGSILYVNPRLAAMVGRSPAELLGTPALDLAAEAHRAALAELLGTRPDEGRRVELELAVNGGATVPVQLSVSESDLNGTLVRCLVATDLSARRAAEADLARVQAALETSEALFRQTQAVTRVGGWWYEVAANRVIWTDEVYRIHELTRAYDPNNVAQDIEFYAPGIGRQYAKPSPWPSRKDDRRPRAAPRDGKGREIWVRTIGQAELENGHVVRVYGNIQDVTDRRRAEEATRRRPVCAEPHRGQPRPPGHDRGGRPDHRCQRRDGASDRPVEGRARGDRFRRLLHRSRARSSRLPAGLPGWRRARLPARAATLRRPSCRSSTTPRSIATGPGA